MPIPGGPWLCAGGRGGSGACAASAAPTWSVSVTATCSRSGFRPASAGAVTTKCPTTSPSAQTGRAICTGGAGKGAGTTCPNRSTTGMVPGRGSALKAQAVAWSTAWISSATEPMKTATSAPEARRAAASRTRPRSTVATPSPCRARAARMASSPVSSPTTTRAIAVATSLCLAMVNRS